VLKRGRNRLEDACKGRADGRHGRDDHDRDESSDKSILDGGHAGLVPHETLN